MADKASDEVGVLRAAIEWALGVNGDFPGADVEGRGRYFWRYELRRRAGVTGYDENGKAIWAGPRAAAPTPPQRIAERLAMPEMDQERAQLIAAEIDEGRDLTDPTDRADFIETVRGMLAASREEGEWAVRAAAAPTAPSEEIACQACGKPFTEMDQERGVVGMCYGPVQDIEAGEYGHEYFHRECLAAPPEELAALRGLLARCCKHIPQRLYVEIIDTVAALDRARQAKS